MALRKTRDVNRAVKYFTKIRIMSSTIKHQRSDAVRIFSYALDQVAPMKMIHVALSKDVNNNCLRVCGDKTFSLSSMNLSVIGFGKAVAEMAVAVNEILGNDIKQGILSVPLGTKTAFERLGIQGSELFKNPKFRIYEGAENNLPDENSMIAATEILKLIQKLREDDLLLLLISGGGSALLPAPIPPVTLEDKIYTTKLLASAGATIQELNTVRTQLSRLKGGWLAKTAYPAQVVSLILSDVIGDPLDIIASGPTFIGNKGVHYPQKALEIISKYMVGDKLPSNVFATLQNRSSNDDEDPSTTDHVHNYLIGNNQTALKCAQDYAQTINYTSSVLSSDVCGEAKHLGQFYAQLGHFLVTTFHNKIVDSQVYESLLLRGNRHGIEKPKLDELIKLLPSSRNMAVVSGGETTVKVTGTGVGGRNQETVLAFKLELEKLSHTFNTCEITFLSAGTDGQDGPTDATGAVAYKELPAELTQSEIDVISSYLENNDSYTYFKRFQPDDLIVTGVTGTNVMDVHMLLVQF